MFPCKVVCKCNCFLVQTAYRVCGVDYHTHIGAVYLDRLCYLDTFPESRKSLLTFHSVSFRHNVKGILKPFKATLNMIGWRELVMIIRCLNNVFNISSPGDVMYEAVNILAIFPRDVHCKFLPRRCIV